MSKRLLLVSAVALLFGAGCSSTSTQTPVVETPTPQIDASGVTITPPTDATSPAPTEASLDTKDRIKAGAQEAGKTFTLDRVFIGKKGFVVVQIDVKGKPGKVYGSSDILNAGETLRVDVALNLATKNGQTFWATLYEDNGDGFFNIAKDMILKDNIGNSVTEKIVVGTPEKKEGEDETAEAEPAKTRQISISGFAYVPSTITVKKGDRIIFTNKDSVAHTVTADGGAFTSGNMDQNGVYTLETSTLAPGDYPYHCTVHPNMKAVLVVE